MYTKGDFHMHSTISDGEYSPDILVKKAKEAGLDIMALTDHNKVDGFLLASEKGKELGVKVLLATEISCRYKGEKVHVLGYFYDESLSVSPYFLQSLYLIRKKQYSALSEEIKEVLSPFIHNDGDKIHPFAASKFIKYFGGLSVLVHPVKISNRVIYDLLSNEFDGIEAIYFKNSPFQTMLYLELCRSNNLIYSAGSDFHTDLKIDNRHGLIGQCSLNSEEISLFLERLKQASKKNKR